MSPPSALLRARQVLSPIPTPDLFNWLDPSYENAKVLNLRFSSSICGPTLLIFVYNKPCDPQLSTGTNSN